MADGEVFTGETGWGLVVSTGILGDLVLPAGAFDPGAERLSGISCGGGHIGI
jgi:hypothetical protein